MRSDSMRRPLVGFALVAVPVMLASLSCGGPGGSPNLLQPAMGPVTILGGDAPACDIISAPVTIPSATLTPQGGGTPVTLISPSSPITVDFASLSDILTLLSQTSVPTGTYSTLTVQLATPQLMVINTGVTPPVPIALQVPTSAVTLSFHLSPALVVSATGPAVVQVDFNLLQSAQVDSSGQLTGALNPVVQVALPTPAVTVGFGEMEDLSGIIQSVNSSVAAGSSFAGSFTLPMPGVAGQTLTINTTNNTLFDNVSGLGGLVAGKTFAEVDAFLDAQGNVVANEVDAEAEEDPSLSQAAFLGVVTSVTRNSSGNATQLTVYVRQAQPALSGVMVPGLLTFNLTSSTQEQLFPTRINQGNIPLGPANLGPGQEVVVHGQLPTAGSTFNANAIFLHLQSVGGSFAATPPPVVASDGLTGGFSFAPCSTLLSSNPMTVFTFFNTAFPGVTGGGLAGLPSSSFLLAKGLVFYEPNSIAVNGMSAVTPGVVEEAIEVHQIP
jgi:hypothetical protein